MNARQAASLPKLPVRDKDSHKGDYGRALLVGGSRGMTGAIALAGMAALRGGAGLVHLAVAEVCQAAVAAVEPSYMTISLPADREGRIAGHALDELMRHAESFTAIACGPGLGRSLGLTHLVSRLHQDVPRPMVLDADALNALAERTDVLSSHAGPRILTPHPGEFARLLATEKRLSRAEMCAQADSLAAKWRVVIVLKGNETFITDGSQTATNTTGNPGMATGGAGDVLTGLITALLCQGLAPFDAARLGVHVHGLAGDLAAEQLGQVALMASDLVRFLPQAFQRLAAS